MTRSGITAALAGLALAATTVMAGCGSDEQATSESATSSPAQSTQSEQGAGGEVTITHAFGQDTYPVSPERVLAMGRTAVDNVLALGVKPAAVVIMERDLDSPWWEGKLDDVEVITVADFQEFKQEAYAAVKPDFIVGDGWKVTKDTYPRLKEIAPTLGVAGDDSAGRSWEKQLEMLGKVFDKEAEAKQVIADTDQAFADAKAEMAGLEGKHAIVSQFIGDMKAFGVVANPEEPGNSFIYRLGMSVPETITDYPEQDKGRVTLSPENIDKMAADFMVIGARGGTAEDIEAIPGFSELPQVKSGAYKMAEAVLLQALNTPSSQSLTWALDQLRPELAKAAGADSQ